MQVPWCLSLMDEHYAEEPSPEATRGQRLLTCMHILASWLVTASLWPVSNDVLSVHLT